MFNIFLRFVICVLIWFRKITRLVHLRLIIVFICFRTCFANVLMNVSVNSFRQNGRIIGRDLFSKIDYLFDWGVLFQGCNRSDRGFFLSFSDPIILDRFLCMFEIIRGFPCCFFISLPLYLIFNSPFAFLGMDLAMGEDSFNFPFLFTIDKVWVVVWSLARELGSLYKELEVLHGMCHVSSISLVTSINMWCRTTSPWSGRVLRISS